MIPLILTLLIIVFISLIKGFKENPTGSILNPLFWLLLYSSFYFLIPLLYLDYSLEVTQFKCSTHAKSSAALLSIWYVLIFYICYLKSSNITCIFSKNSPSRISYIFSLACYTLITCLLIFIIIRYVPSIYALKDDRASALTLYESTVNGRFKLRILMYCHFCTMFILFWNNKKLYYLLPCILYVLIDFSHGGRTVTLMNLTFCYFIITLKTGKTYVIHIFCCLLLMIISGIVQRSSVYNFFVEFISCRCGIFKHILDYIILT